ncbi:putative sieve element occlusion [Rosa chinensis]|uniref:Putative sieve element occlusion n=1 Tax=Rosa chinensis TaxID=74649 RepID=A0A2P6QVT1_ROSCH|nr:putative sieve element occlusion [Rosa chinensis]
MLGLAFNVATKVAAAVHPTHKTIDEEFSLFAMSDKQILQEIYTTHVHADETLDDDSLFIIVENILKHATQNVDEIVQGIQVHVDNIEEKNPKASFSVPLCTLKGISCEMQCKPPGDEIAHNTTVAILNKLSKYSWEAKASLTLAAFAMEYGEFWLLAQLRKSDHLAKSIAILKRVPVLLKPTELQKRRQSILQLNNLIKSTLQVIECIGQFNKYSRYLPKEFPGLSIASEHIPVDVYWAIITVVACAKEEETYIRIKKLFQTPTEIMEVFKGLIFTKDNVQPLVDGSTKQTVNIDILRRKNVLLFISSLDITDDDISILKPIHEFTKKDNQYNIVWIPIVEQWTDDLRKKFDILKNKIPWFTVQYPGPIAGIKYIKKDWNFKGKPTMVVMNPHGKVEHPNAVHMVRVWGVKAFPFTETREAELSHSDGEQWVSSVVNGIHPSLPTWIKENKYIFFYGGKDNVWIQNFKNKATALAKDPIFKEAKIELVCVGKDSKGEDDRGVLGRFWTGVESLFLTTGQWQVDSVSEEIQKLLSYKNESGWAVLCKGSTVLVTAHGVSVLKVVEDFEKWKDPVKENGFEFCFTTYYGTIIQGSRQPCCRVDIPGSNGKVPDSMKCPDCHRSMETIISYKCCHTDGPIAHH